MSSKADIVRKELQKFERAEVEFKEKEKHFRQKEKKLSKTIHAVTLVLFSFL
jgi:hypothetical protein